MWEASCDDKKSEKNSKQINNKKHCNFKAIQQELAGDNAGPEGPPSRAPCPYRKAKETDELILSWLSLLAVFLVGACVRRQRRQRWSHARGRPYSS